MTARQDTGPLDAAIGGALLIVGPLLAALGAVTLFMSLFLEWYEPNLSGWTAFEALDLVLALGALAGIALSLASLALAIDIPGAALGRLGSIALRRPILPALGAAALVVVVSQLLSEPPPAVDGEPQVGAWLALAGAGLLTVGGILASNAGGAGSPQ